MRLLLLLAATACLQNVDSTALDGNEGHSHFLQLTAQPTVVTAESSDNNMQATITEMKLAGRKPFGQDQELQAGTPLNDAGPLIFDEIVFNFTATDAKKYDCKLESKIKLSQKIPFSSSADCVSPPPPTPTDAGGNGSSPNRIRKIFWAEADNGSSDRKLFMIGVDKDNNTMSIRAVDWDKNKGDYVPLSGEKDCIDHFTNVDVKSYHTAGTSYSKREGDTELAAWVRPSGITNFIYKVTDQDGKTVTYESKPGLPLPNGKVNTKSITQLLTVDNC